MFKLKTILLVVALTGGMFFSNAQNFEVGLLGGYGVSNLKLENYQTSSTGVGNFGIIGQYNFGERWAVASKVLYEQKGFKGSSTVIAEVKEKINYISVPLLAKYFLGDRDEDIRVYLQGGGYYSFFQSAERSFDIENLENEDTSHLYEDSDYGVAVGLGLDIWITERLSLLIDAQADIGLADVRKDISEASYTGVKFGIGLLYSLN